jgi:glycosyltransferase involved in cell wall biosynthesis
MAPNTAGAPDPTVIAGLRALATHGTVIDALRAAGDLAAAVGPSTPARALRALSAAAADVDPLLAMGAIHALAEAPGGAADPVLAALLDADETWRREHAAWALAERPPSPAGTARLLEMAAAGGFGAMLAQATLGRQALSDGGALGGAVATLLRRHAAPAARARLVETLGLDPRREAAAMVEEVALDADEAPTVRSAAVAALGDRGGPGARAVLTGLASSTDGELATQALLALLSASARRASTSDAPAGLSIAQLYLHADLDAGLTQAGAGDTGGIASLLVLLADALAETPRVGKELTLCRGAGGDALADALWPRPETASFGAVPMPRVPMRDAWEHRIVVERGIRRQLLTQGPFDVLHLRMADVGTLAAARVAKALGIPVVFTAAPDPHASLEAMGAQGGPGRAGLGDLDARDHWWFRARLVERLTRESQRIAVMPRANAMRELPRLLAIDPGAFAARAAVIPEGVHAGTLRAAHRDARRTGSAVPVLADLRRRTDAMPPERRDLPLLVTVGRLAVIKGIDRVVAAWAGDPVLRAEMNLVVVGGDLEDPSPEEREVLSAIDAVLGRGPDAREGLVMLGHRPHLDAARVLAHAALGAGVYVCGSAKEEYGLAIVEALGAGLAVVAPRVGGPATYLEDGRTGVLVDGTSVDAIRAGIHAARALAAVPGRAETARARVLGEMTIEHMADRLAELYGAAAVRGPVVATAPAGP